MKTPAGILVLLILASALSSCERPPEPVLYSSSYALVGGTLVDSRGVHADDPGIVWIEDDRIKFVGSTDDTVLPDSIPRIDVSGKWILPGLMDLHIHPPPRIEQTEVMRTLLGFGITTARVAAATAESGVDLRKRVEDGVLIGPTILTAGRLIDGPNSVHSSAAEVSTPLEITEEIARQAGEGVDYIKLYTGLDSDLVGEAVKVAHAQNLKVLGHLGSTTWNEAATSGIDAITHSGFVGPIWELIPSQIHPDNDPYGPGAISIEKLRTWIDLVAGPNPGLDALATNLLQHDVEVNPNLVLTWAMVFGSDADSIARFEPEFATEKQYRRWVGRPHPFSLGNYPPGFADSLYQSFASIIVRLHRRGVRITTGTDLAVPWMTPGVALHEEMQLLVEAGLSPTEVLAAATVHSAESMGLWSVGQIREDWRADLIVVEGDPVSDIRNVRKIEMVIKRGVAYYQKDLLLTN